MRQTDDHRRRREQFMSDVLLLASEGTEVTPTVTPGGTPHGADLVTALFNGEEAVDGRTVGKAFSLLWEDRRANGTATEVEGLTTRWRDAMLVARSVNDTSLLSADDARRLLRLGMRAQVAEVPVHA